MENYKYIKYKTKYINLLNNINQFGGDKVNIVVLHNPAIFEKPKVPKHLSNIMKQLSKYGKIYNYFFKFSYCKNKFNLENLEYENAAKDIYDTYEKLNKFILISLSHACPYALYFADIYPKKCISVICYPFRFYSQESYDRRIWKLKNNNGMVAFVKNEKYNVDDYLLNITNDKFEELFDNQGDDEKQIIYLVFDLSIQKQHYKIPTKFKVPTYLYTRLDLDVSTIIKYNYERKEIAKMKQIITKDDALFNSMQWNFDRIKYDALLKENNNDNKNLKIKYLVSGWEDMQDVVDNVIIIIEKYK